MNLILGKVEEFITVVDVDSSSLQPSARVVSRNMDILYVRGDGVILVSLLGYLGILGILGILEYSNNTTDIANLKLHECSWYNWCWIWRFNILNRPNSQLNPGCSTNHLNLVHI